jgi:hypothetical protein
MQDNATMLLTWLAKNGSLNCTRDDVDECLQEWRLVVAAISALAALALAGTLLSNLLHGRWGTCTCRDEWPKLHHYALFCSSLADCFVALSFLVVRACVRACVRPCAFVPDAGEKSPLENATCGLLSVTLGWCMGGFNHAQTCHHEHVVPAGSSSPCRA